MKQIFSKLAMKVESIKLQVKNKNTSRKTLHSELTILGGALKLSIMRNNRGFGK